MAITGFRAECNTCRLAGLETIFPVHPVEGMHHFEDAMNQARLDADNHERETMVKFDANGRPVPAGPSDWNSMHGVYVRPLVRE